MHHFLFSCDGCGRRFHTERIRYCVACCILLCEECLELEQIAGQVTLDTEGDILKHCNQEMPVLKKREADLVASMMLKLDENKPELAKFLSGIFRKNMNFANRLMKEAFETPGLSYTDLPDQVRYLNAYNAICARYWIRADERRGQHRT